MKNNKTQAALERIRILECPTGEFEKRIAGILEDYEVAPSHKVKISRDQNLDRDGAQGYNLSLPGDSQEIVIMATSGADDYVAKVTEIYSS